MTARAISLRPLVGDRPSLGSDRSPFDVSVRERQVFSRAEEHASRAIAEALRRVQADLTSECIGDPFGVERSTALKWITRPGRCPFVKALVLEALDPDFAVQADALRSFLRAQLGQLPGVAAELRDQLQSPSGQAA